MPAIFLVAVMMRCGRYTLDFSRPLVMGILNVTPDSFSDGGRFDALPKALAQAEQMLAQGADLLDIGGESTRPLAVPVSPAQEMERVLPVLEQLRDCGVPVSLDTRRAVVMQQALAIGVDLINDVSALEDPGALNLLVGSQVGICLMHKQGSPATMQNKPRYGDVLAEVGAYLSGRVSACLQAGISQDRLLIDPGFGFGKRLAHNLALLQGLPALARQTGCPLLVGLSRKSMLGEICAEPEASQRLGASIAAALEAARRGAAVIRVHDVKETRQALQVLAALSDQGPVPH